MPAEPRLKVVLCWHMHQPHYLDHESGQYQLPWTYLHAIKDYVDMAAFIEANPAARAVVNFAPTLLKQIDDYAQQQAVAGSLPPSTVGLLILLRIGMALEVLLPTTFYLSVIIAWGGSTRTPR